MRQSVSDSSIIAAYAWPESTARIAWKLGTNASRIFKVWGQAKRDGLLPPGKRPPGGFDPRQSALIIGCMAQTSAAERSPVVNEPSNAKVIVP